MGVFLPRDPSFLFVDDGLRFELGKRRDRIRETDRETGRETDRETDREKDRETDRETDRDTDRETDRETGRDTELSLVCPAQARAPRWRCQAAWVVAPRGGVLGDPRWRQHALALGCRAFHGADARRVAEI